MVKKRVLKSNATGTIYPKGLFNMIIYRRMGLHTAKIQLVPFWVRHPYPQLDTRPLLCVAPPQETPSLASRAAVLPWARDDHPKKTGNRWKFVMDTLWQTNITIENQHF